MSTTFICYQNIYPATDGGKKSSLGRVLEFKKNNPNSVTQILCFNLSPFSVEEAEQSISFFQNHGIFFYPVFSTSFASRFRALGKFLSIFNTCSYYTNFSRSKGLRQKIANYLPEDGAIICEGLHAFWALTPEKQDKAILVAHNIESLFIKSLAKSSKNKLKAIAQLLNAKKTYQEEKQAFDRCKEIIFLNSNEIQTAKEIYSINSNKASVAENILAFPFQIQRNVDLDEPFLLFPGSLNFGPNLEAMEWFRDEIFPVIKNKFSTLRCVITGKYSPGHRAHFSASDGFILTGLISEENLQKMYARCTTVISPIRSGAGIKIKNIEAIALNLPIVMTKTSANGINTNHDLQVVSIDDSGQAFAICLEFVLKKILGTSSDQDNS